jgi:hypothetical protein
MFLGVQADLKSCNEECSGDKVALKRGDEKCFSIPVFKAMEVFLATTW